MGLWPDIDVSRWAGTKRSLHLYTQMLGKMKLARAPMEPNWMFTRLLLTPRGVTTGFIPWAGESFDASIDVFDSTIVLARSNGARATIPLLPVRTVADVYADVAVALEKLKVECAITPVPQEIPDTTPLDQDRRPSEYDPAAVLRWFQATTATADVFDEWRSHFFGRTGIQLWWGAFDFALILFNGRHVAAPIDRGYLMKYDLDAELMNVGLYYGDDKAAPFFYGYIYPEPPGAEKLPVATERGRMVGATPRMGTAVRGSAPRRRSSCGHPHLRRLDLRAVLRSRGLESSGVELQSAAFSELAAHERMTAMLKPGDRVYIDGTKEEGTVKEVHPHEVVVRVATAEGHELRKYTYEDLRLDPTLGEVSKFVDH